MQQYRIVSSQSPEVNGRVIYCLLAAREQSVRISIERRPDWEVGMTVTLDPAFVEANLEK